MGDSQLAVFTGHGLVLLYLAKKPDATMREMSLALDLTERRVAGIVRDLVDSLAITKTKIGRRNLYRLNEEMACLPPALSSANLGAIARAAIGPEERVRREDRQVAPSLLHALLFPILASDSQVLELVPGLLTAFI